MQKVYFIGLDIAKSIFQLFMADQHGKQISNRKMNHGQMIQFFSNLPPRTIGIEAGGTAHHWVRPLSAMGHTVNLIQAVRVKAFLGGGNKTDAADAKAICEALMHPGATFVKAKTIEQQDIDHLLNRRQRLVEARTCVINQTMAFLAERGILIPQGTNRFKSLIPQICSEYWEEFSGTFQMVLSDNFSDFLNLEDEICKIDKQIKAHSQQNESCKKLMSIPGRKS